MTESKLYLSILKHLDKGDLTSYTDITKLLKKRYPDWNSASHFIFYMGENNHLDYINNGSQVNDWSIGARITLIGRDYYREVSKSKSSRRYNIISLIVSILAVAVSAYFSFKSLNNQSQVDKLENRIKILERKS